MSVTADQVSKITIRISDLNKFIQEQLRMIDDGLLISEKKWGRNVYEFDLPTSFTGFQSIPRLELQKTIYVTLIRSLEDRGFEVKIFIENKDRVKLLVAWNISTNQEEDSALLGTLKNHSLSFAEVEEFYKKSELRPAVLPPAKNFKVTDDYKLSNARGGIVDAAPPKNIPDAEFNTRDFMDNLNAI